MQSIQLCGWTGWIKSKHFAKESGRIGSKEAKMLFAGPTGLQNNGTKGLESKLLSKPDKLLLLSCCISVQVSAVIVDFFNIVFMLTLQFLESMHIAVGQ